MRDRAIIAVGAGALIVGVMVVFELLRPSRVETSIYGGDPGLSGKAPWENDSDGAPSTDGLETEGNWALTLGPNAGRRIRFVDPRNGQGQPTLMLVGAPGMWPPETRQTNRKGVGALPKLETTTLRGKPVHTWEVLGRSADGQRAFWSEIEAADLRGEGIPTFKMERASALHVEVVDGGGAPVPRAHVRLSRDSVGFVHVNKRSGDNGHATFRAVPAGDYRLTAESKDGARATKVLEHDGQTERRLTLRVETTERAAIPEGSSTASPVEFTLTGLEDEQWSAASVAWRAEGRDWQPATLQREGANRSARVWRRTLAPGDYALRVRGPDGATAQHRFRVEGRRIERSWQIALADRTKVYVTDEWARPIGGAWVQIWSDGRLVKTTTSRGDQPIPLEARPGQSYRVFAATARQGEGLKVVDAGREGDRREGNEEWIVELDSPLMTHEVPPGRVREVSRLESILGQPVVEDGRAYLVDATDPDSAAMRAGIERGDALIAVWDGGSAWQVILRRDGAIRSVEIRR